MQIGREKTLLTGFFGVKVGFIELKRSLEMKTEILNKRLKSVRKGMAKEGIGCLVLESLENICYLSGFTGHDSWVIVTGRGVTLITDSRYTEQARDECFGCKIVERTESVIKETAKLIGKSKSIKTVGIENSSSVAVFKAFKKELSVKLKAVSGIVEVPRRGKDLDEVKLVEKAGKISYESLFETVSSMEVGMKESDFAGRLEYEMRKRGAVFFFDTIACFGANGSRNHHQPGSRKLRKNDTVLIDFGAKYKSYGCDITRSFAVGKPSALYEKVWFTVKAAQKAAIEAVAPGVKLSEIDRIARSVIDAEKLPVYKHGTGHGMGLMVHEGPYMSAKAKGVLEVGDVITVEPGIYMPGKLGVRIEDDILVTESGYKVLTVDKKYGFSGAEMPVFSVR